MINDADWYFICSNLKNVLLNKSCNINYTNTEFNYDIVTNKFGEHVTLLKRNNIESISVLDNNIKLFCKNNVMFTINNGITKGFYVN